MKLARYWSRDSAEAGDARVVARGWSDESLEAARAKAREIARRVAERLLTLPDRRSQYPYGDRPLPEPVLREFRAAAVTRNAYGALVLNTDELMFVDIDRQPAATGNVVSNLLSLFRKPAAPPADPELEGIRRVAERHGLLARVYQTAAGYRALIANRTLRAGSSESETLFRDFGADPMYVRLCRLQDSFRARLTPKPWRCGFRNPPVEFPFETPQDEAKFKRWESEYTQRAGNYATCRFLATVGPGLAASEFSELIAYHDRETKATSSQQLA
jgi:hypothetical protein